MGCRFACVCGGKCIGCSRYEKEGYFGEAEDLRAQELGYQNYEVCMHYQEEPKEGDQNE